LALSFTGCTKDHPTPSYTKAWLHDADGDVLMFRNASTGATETFLASVEDVTHTIKPKLEVRSFELQNISLTYVGQNDSQAGLYVVLDGYGQVTFQPTINSSSMQVVLETDRKSHKEGMYASENANARIETNLELNGRTYARLAHGEFSFTASEQQNPQTAKTLREFWYSKDEGLVAYTKTNGQTWYRVW
jgi:hypothetical protein